VKRRPCIRHALQFHEFVDAWNIWMYLEDMERNLEIFKDLLGP